MTVADSIFQDARTFTFTQAIAETTLHGTLITHDDFPWGMYFCMNAHNHLVKYLPHAGEVPISTRDIEEWAKMDNFKTLQRREVAKAWLHDVLGTEEPSKDAPEVWF